MKGWTAADVQDIRPKKQVSIKEYSSIFHYGRRTPRSGIESQFQIEAINFIRLKYDPIAYHVPNGGKRHIASAAKLKREGLLKGVPDIVIDKPHGIYSGARIELKIKGGQVKPHQLKIMQELQVRGYFVAVCWNMDGLERCLMDYFETTK